MPQPDSRRKSYVLSVQPVDYSLTAGTNIPAPEYSPPPTPNREQKLAKLEKLSRPPTAGGGPLSAHPVEDSMPPPAVPGAFPPSPEPERTSNNMSSDSHRNTTDSSVRPPTSPASTNHMQSPPRERRPSSARRLFSLNSLRQSFSSSRTSLSVPPGSSYDNYSNMRRSQTPDAPSIMTTTTSATKGPYSSQSGNKLQKKRNSQWFKRKSGFFNVDENGMLDIVDEDRENKRFKPQTLPMLPEISTLGGGDLNEGSLGWDEASFKR